MTTRVDQKFYSNRNKNSTQTGTKILLKQGQKFYSRNSTQQLTSRVKGTIIGMLIKKNSTQTEVEMAVISVFKDGEWVDSDDVSLDEVESVIESMENSTLEILLENSTGPREDPDEVVDRARGLVEKTVEKPAVAQKHTRGDKVQRERAMEIVVRLTEEGKTSKEIIKFLRESLDLTYPTARYYTVVLANKS